MKVTIQDNLKKILPVLAALIAITAIVGWSLDISWMKSLFYSKTTMKVNTALSVLSLSIAVYFIDRKWSVFFAAFTFLLSFLIVSQDFTGINLGIDELIFTDPRLVPSRWPSGRPSPVTSISLVLMAISVLLRRSRSKKFLMTSQLIAVFVWLMSFQSVLSFLEGVSATYGTVLFAQMAIHNSITFLLLTTTLILYGPDMGITSILIRKTPSSRVIQWLLGLGILLPPFAIWIKSVGETHLWWTSDFGTVVVIVINVFFFSYIIYIAGINLIRAEDAQLNAQNDLRSSIKLRDDFLSLASHELKTPLTSIKLQSQLFQRQMLSSSEEARSPEKIQKFLNMNDRQIDRLNRLVDTMLDISRIDSKKIILHKGMVDIVSLVRDISESLAPNFKIDNCEFHFKNSPPIPGHWDQIRLEQIFLNLLSNASKYGQNSRIDVSFNLLPNLAQVTISNGGKGIASKDLERIFNRFERATDINESTGLGLGLYISKTLIELHGGSIQVESIEGEGAKFIVNLPLV